ncbi:MAG: hypothetical protein K2H86_00230 [Muribaculaceae bacterium]|nr:hypothetical protein [Muribaculaceae bacterium]
MIKGVFKYILICIATWSVVSCSEHDMPFPSDTIQPGISIVLPVLETKSLHTRGDVDDMAVNSLTVLTFNGTDSNSLMVQSPYQVTDWDKNVKSDNTIELDFMMQLDSSLSDRSNLSFLIFANLPSEITQNLLVNETKRVDIDNIALDISQSADGQIVMCGETTYIALFAPSGDTAHKVIMKRNVCAIEAYMQNESNPMKVVLYGAPSSVSITSGLSDTPPLPVNNEDASEGVEDGNRIYAAPVKHNSVSDPYSLSALPFIITQAQYEGTTYFYKLSFATLDNDNNPVGLDLSANHLYKYLISEVNVPGYTSSEEAAQGIPSSVSDVKYTILDLQPAIYNMASDGFTELGITNMVVDPLGDPCEKEFYVKCFPAITDASQLSFTYNAEWVSVMDEPIEITEVEDTSGQKASLLKYKAMLDRNPFSEIREATIQVHWRGLTTDILVRQELNFTADKHTDIVLEIREKDGTLYRRINNYWSFLNGEGTTTDPGIKGSTVNAPILYGTTSEVNGGNVRTHGLHFPVLNGGRSYNYTISPDFGPESGAVKYKAFLKRNFGFTGSLSLDNSEKNLGESVSITMTGDNDIVGIAESTLVLMSYDENGTAVDMLSLDLYHCGIFDWSDYPQYRCDRTNDPKIEEAWYYYEVVPFLEGNEIVYWLDRNVGSRSRGFDIVDGAGLTIFDDEPSYPFLNGDGSARGGIYHEIATPSTTYDDPVMKNDFGPPGYKIPSESLFNDLRNSSNFITHRTFSPSGISYYTAYLLTQEGERIYFPKNCQLQNHVITSESRSGHYWTSTPAYGFEKDEIGKWLTIFILSGNSSSMSRARLVNPENAMSARLVNEAANSTEYYQTFLKVKGATHVFLYALNGDEREWPVPWPGTAVTNPDIAFDDFVNFVYESSRNVDYKVIFNFVTDSGEIITMAESESGKGINATGWSATGIFNFDKNHNFISN